jgi:hypothetical protein
MDQQEVPEKWRTYKGFRDDMIARQRDAEAHGFEPTLPLLSWEPWPPDWDQWGQPNITISRLAQEIEHRDVEIAQLKQLVARLRTHHIYVDSCWGPVAWEALNREAWEARERSGDTSEPQNSP